MNFRLTFKNQLVILFLLFCFVAKAQENLTVYNEPGFSVKIETDTPWSYDFGIAHRRLVYANEEYAFVAKNIELSHTTSYKIENFGKLGLGIKYKFIELFDETSPNELRITQQFSRSKEFSTIEIGHRFRIEERFENNTSFRTRYQFSVEIPLSRKENKDNGFYLELATEALLSMANGAAPEIDQRFALELKKGLWENVGLKIGLEYQYENYNHDPEVDLFLLSGISISL